MVRYATGPSGEYALAFIEANEIAYCCSDDPALYSDFVDALIEELFIGYERIMFECDDCDKYMSILASMFKAPPSDRV